jgi:hypothetical protein
MIDLRQEQQNRAVVPREIVRRPPRVDRYETRWNCRWSMWSWLAARARSRHKRCTWYSRHGKDPDLRKRLAAEREFRAAQERECWARREEMPTPEMLARWRAVRVAGWLDGTALELLIWGSRITRAIWFKGPAAPPRRIVQPRWCAEK